jgi:hypothetical protein
MNRDEIAAKLINKLPSLPSAPLSAYWLDEIYKAVCEIIEEQEITRESTLLST